MITLHTLARYAGQEVNTEFWDDRDDICDEIDALVSALSHKEVLPNSFRVRRFDDAVRSNNNKKVYKAHEKGSDVSQLDGPTISSIYDEILKTGKDMKRSGQRNFVATISRFAAGKVLIERARGDEDKLRGLRGLEIHNRVSEHLSRINPNTQQQMEDAMRKAMLAVAQDAGSGTRPKKAYTSAQISSDFQRFGKT